MSVEIGMGKEDEKGNLYLHIDPAYGRSIDPVSFSGRAFRSSH